MAKTFSMATSFATALQRHGHEVPEKDGFKAVHARIYCKVEKKGYTVARQLQLQSMWSRDEDFRESVEKAYPTRKCLAPLKVAKLSGDNKLVKWSGKSDGTLEQIVLKMAVLGPGAKSNERNIVEMTTFDSEQGKIKACICSLSMNKAENQQLSDISLYPPVHFTLVEGSGPVHLVANHMLLDDDDLSDDDMSDYEEEIGNMQELQASIKKMAEKKSGQGDAPKKTATKIPVEDIEDDDDDLDDDLEDDDDDDLNVEDFLDMEAEDEDEISLDDEEEEEEDVAPKKRKLANGKAKVEKNVDKTVSPEKSKQKKLEPKSPKTPKNGELVKTPKSERKTPSKPRYTSVEEVKLAIKKIPGGKPRKQDKFTNWLENQFKVEKDSWKTDLWMWHKKEQGL